VNICLPGRYFLLYVLTYAPLIFGTQRNSFLIRYQIRLATCLDTELLFPLLILGLLLLCYRIAKSGVISYALGGVSKTSNFRYSYSNCRQVRTQNGEYFEVSFRFIRVCVLTIEHSTLQWAFRAYLEIGLVPTACLRP
jgi:hypothetical protein